MRIGPPLMVGAALICCAAAISSLVWRGSQPFRGYETPTRTVVIEPGKPARVAASQLHAAGVIRSPLLFRLLMRVRGAEEKIHAGEYEFAGEMTPYQVLERLIRGDVLLHRLTLPEGLRLDETAVQFEQAGFGRRDEFLAAAKDPRPIADIDPAAADLEGYLFPDTYFFPRGTPVVRIVSEMVARFRKELTPQRQTRMKELGLTPRQAVTLASLVEEEAHADDERPRIAAVFHNRLRSGMLLQCDPTVVYALVREGKYRGEIYRSDLAHRSPYNTYVYPGLPPGPICSPGVRSLDAALYPALTQELYFVVSGPGRHRFSTSIEEHQAAVRQYRRELGRFNRRP